jgi:L-iditol 2-dehydrogenase
MGGGTIGLFTLQWARIFGAKTITVFDIDDARLEFLKGYGADFTINTKKEGYHEAAMDITRGSGFGYVFETAGQPFTMNLAFRIAAIKASVCFIGTPHTDLTFDPITWELMNRKEFRLTGSWMSYSAPYPGREWTLVAHNLAKGELRIGDDLIYKTYPLSEGKAAFMNFKDGPVRGKVILTNY